MRFFLDENFPHSAASVIQACGHEAVPFSVACACGASDEAVFNAAQNLGAVLLTSDRDFYHTIPLMHPQHCGIVVVALRQPSRAAIAARLKWFLENNAEPLVNRVVILRDFSYRMR